jgi:hypothetical protein
VTLDDNLLIKLTCYNFLKFHKISVLLLAILNPNSLSSWGLLQRYKECFARVIALVMYAVIVRLKCLAMHPWPKTENRQWKYQTVLIWRCYFFSNSVPWFDNVHRDQRNIASSEAVNVKNGWSNSEICYNSLDSLLSEGISHRSGWTGKCQSSKFMNFIARAFFTRTGYMHYVVRCQKIFATIRFLEISLHFHDFTPCGTKNKHPIIWPFCRYMTWFSSQMIKNISFSKHLE